MKLSKAEKDKYPKIYGYGSVEQLEADPTRFGDDKDNPLTHWVPFIDRDEDLRFEPCTKEYFYFYRNSNRNDERREQSYRYKFPISIDSLREDYEFEFVDPSYELSIEEEKQKEIANKIWSLVSEFSETDQIIIKLFTEGHTDTSIGQKLNRARQTIQGKRTKLLEKLREKAEKFK